jgi:DNA-binding SARP family transcriptional activator
LDETGKRALDLRIHADMLMGRHRDIIGELRSLAAGSPYNEWYQSVLISALASAGRRHEALAVYAEAQRVLSEDLGLSPSAQLRAVFQAVLDGEMPDLTDCGMNITTAS